MFGSKFDYLKLSSKTVQDIIHDDVYIKEGLEQTGYRRIYQDVEYDYFEKKQISKFKEIIRSLNLTVMSDDVILRYLYAGYFNETNTIELYKRYLAWINQANLSFLPDKVQHYLKEGVVYIGGRDYQYRPIIIINLHLLNFYLFDTDCFLHALQTLLVICEDYMFYPSKVENIVIIIEANDISIYQFPNKSFQVIIWMLSQNFPQILDRLYIFNPSKELIGIWDHFSNYIDSRTLKKIEMWDSKTFAPLAHGFHPDMLEKKFGGGMADITQHWLPVQILQQPSSINYKIQKPLYGGGTIQYSLYNDPQELLERLGANKSEEQQEEIQQQSVQSKKSSSKSVQQNKLNYHETMGQMFKVGELKSIQGLQSQDLSLDFQNDQYNVQGFQGKSAITQQFRSEAVIPQLDSQKNVQNQSTGSLKNYKPISFGQANTYQPQKYQPLQSQQPRAQTVQVKGQKIAESFDANVLNDSQNREQNVQACNVM